MDALFAEIQALRSEIHALHAHLGEKLSRLDALVATLIDPMKGRQNPPPPQGAQVATPPGQGRPGEAEVAAARPTPPEERGVYRRGKNWWAKFANQFLGAFPTKEAAVAARRKAYERYRLARQYGGPDVEVVHVRNYVPAPSSPVVPAASTIPPAQQERMNEVLARFRKP